MNITLNAIVLDQRENKAGDRVYMTILDRDTGTQINATSAALIEKSALYLPLVITAEVDAGQASYVKDGQRKTFEKFEFLTFSVAPGAPAK